MSKTSVMAALFITVLLASGNAPFAQALDNPQVVARQSEWFQATSAHGEELFSDDPERPSAAQHARFAAPPPAAHGVTVVSRGLIGNIVQILEFNLSVGYLFGGQQTSVIQNGNETRGDDIRITQASLRPDVRFYLGSFANIPNIGNVGNLGFGLTNCYAGIQGAIGLSGADSGLNTDQHGADNQPDTKLSVKYSGGLTPYVGCQIFQMPNNLGYFNLQGGPRFWWVEQNFVTDESQGGGNLEYRSETFTTVGGAFGLEYNLPFSGIGNLPPGVDGHLQLGMWGEYVPGNDIQVMTSTFNIDYIGRTQGTWLGTVRGGIGIRF